jgi:hypothetical protein
VKFVNFTLPKLVRPGYALTIMELDFNCGPRQQGGRFEVRRLCYGYTDCL